MAKNKKSGEAVVGKWDLSAGDEGFDAEKVQKREKIKHIVKNVLVYIFLTICAVLAFLPFYWMISSVNPFPPSSRTPSSGKTIG